MEEEEEFARSGAQAAVGLSLPEAGGGGIISSRGSGELVAGAGRPTAANRP